jgi:hypothetical protein
MLTRNDAIAHLRSRGLVAGKGPPCYGKQSLHIASATEKVGEIRCLLDVVVLAKENERWVVIDESSPRHRIPFESSLLSEAVESTAILVVQRKKQREAKGEAEPKVAPECGGIT